MCSLAQAHPMLWSLKATGICICFVSACMGTTAQASRPQQTHSHAQASSLQAPQGSCLFVPSPRTPGAGGMCTCLSLLRWSGVEGIDVQARRQAVQEPGIPHDPGNGYAAGWVGHKDLAQQGLAGLRERLVWRELVLGCMRTPLSEQ